MAPSSFFNTKAMIAKLDTLTDKQLTSIMKAEGLDASRFARVMRNRIACQMERYVQREDMMGFGILRLSINNPDRQVCNSSPSPIVSDEASTNMSSTFFNTRALIAKLEALSNEQLTTIMKEEGLEVSKVERVMKNGIACQLEKYVQKEDMMGFGILRLSINNPDRQVNKSSPSSSPSPSVSDEAFFDLASSTIFDTRAMVATLRTLTNQQLTTIMIKEGLDVSQVRAVQRNRIVHEMEKYTENEDFVGFEALRLLILDLHRQTRGSDPTPGVPSEEKAVLAQL